MRDAPPRSLAAGEDARKLAEVDEARLLLLLEDELALALQRDLRRERAELLAQLREFDPPLLLRRHARGDGHNERHQPVLARARHRRVVHERVDERNRLRRVRLLVPRHEEIVWQVGVAGERGAHDARRVRVHVVRHDQRRRAEHLRALVVAVWCLPAHVDRGLLAVGEAHDDVGRVVRLRPRQRLDGFVDLAAARREDLHRLRVHEEARHVEVVHRHVLEDAAAALDVLKRGRRRVARAELDLDDLADLIAGDRLLHAGEVGVEAPLQRHHQLHVLLAAVVDLCAWSSAAKSVSSCRYYGLAPRPRPLGGI
mmetsp:Transcript_40486/g.106808  ORF Transcript_40486/g.106808 Transcript_40486/m.106808 type:complete len:312 (+) Transcript_40486:423-1358(+)